MNYLGLLVRFRGLNVFFGYSWLRFCMLYDCESSLVFWIMIIEILGIIG